MSKLNILWIVPASLLLFFTLFKFVALSRRSSEPSSIVLRGTFTQDDVIKLYYAPKGFDNLAEDRTVIVDVKGNKDEQDILLNLGDIKDIQQLRLDISQNPAQSTIRLSSIILHSGPNNAQIPLEYLQPNAFIQMNGSLLTLTAVEDAFDPFVVFGPQALTLVNDVINAPANRLLWTLIFTGMVIACYFSFRLSPSAAIAATCSLALFLIIYQIGSYWPEKNAMLVITIKAVVEKDDRFQVYVLPDHVKDYSEQYSLSVDVKGLPYSQDIQFAFPDTFNVKSVRIDLGQNRQQSPILLEQIALTGKHSFTVAGDEIFNFFTLNGFLDREQNQNIVRPHSVENTYSDYDPFIHSAELASSGRLTSQIPYRRILVASIFAIAMFVAFMQNTFSNATSVLQYSFIVLFIGMLVSPWFEKIFDLPVGSVNSEQRTLASKPLLALDTWLDYPVAFEKFYNDNFGFRAALVNWGSAIKVHGFKAPIDPTRAVIGKENWVFFPGESFNVLSDINRWNRFSDSHLKQVASILEDKNKSLSEKGIKFYFCPWPDKHVIYPEYLPNTFRIQSTDEPSRLDQLKTYLHETKSNVNYVDVRPALLNHKDVQLYSKNDTHWNHYGAFIAYQDLMKAITTDFPTAGSIRTLDEYDVQWKPSASGDLLNILGMSGAPVFTEQAPTLTPRDKVHFAVKEIPAENYPAGKSMLHRNDSCTNKLRVLVFRDSYTGAVIPFFSTNFYEVLYIWHVYDPAIVDQFKPDIVVESFVSRFAFY